MSINIINRLKFFFKQRFDKNLILNASSYFSLKREKYSNIKHLKELEFKVFSQNGEDGIIDYLIYALNIRKLKFVEIGIGNKVKISDLL